MAMTKAELLAKKMKEQQVGAAAFAAGKTPAVETQTPAAAHKPAQEEPQTPGEYTDTTAASLPGKGPQKAAEKGRGNSRAKAKTPEKKKTDAAQKPEKPAKLLDTLPKRKRIEKKTSAYYISVANVEKLEKAAKAADTSASDLLDNILTAVFSE